jgi:hypothetical protein
MKKTTYVVGVVVLLAALLALPGVGQSAMWVGAEIGGNFVPNSSVDASFPGLGNVTLNDVNFRPSVIGGATIGYDFVNSGFGAYAWPDWMKYFSFAMDITYNHLDADLNNATVNGVNIGPFFGPNLINKDINGYVVAWTFLFMAHYGFFPDSEIPTGRVNPYIGVGPAVVWSGLDLGGLGGGRVNATNIALVVEPGIRWVCFKHVSIDTAFRYRYCAPSYDISGASLKVNPLNQLSFLVRANYHF